MSKLSCLWEKAVLGKKLDHITLMKNKKIHTFGKFISTNQHKLRLIKSIYNVQMWCRPERKMVVMVELIRIYINKNIYVRKENVLYQKGYLAMG